MRTKLSVETVRGEFQRQIELISGETLLSCNQCGKCSAGCPVAYEMDFLPSQVIRMAQLGMEDVIESSSIWICATCMTCIARCPKGIDLPRVMEALRLIAMQRNGNRMQAEDLSPEVLGEIPQLAIIGGFRKYST
jgi:heterodisulfide reductase subunit C2